MDIATEKAELRRRFLRERGHLTVEAVEGHSKAIAERVRGQRALNEAPTILTYIAMGREVDTRLLIASWLEEGREICVPVVVEDNLLAWSRLTDMASLHPSRLGPPEPNPDKTTICLPPISAPVLVPGVAFTSDGARLGRGSGHFDRFLSSHGGLKIGLAFDLQIVDRLPEEPHDQRMDCVITESATHECP